MNRRILDYVTSGLIAISLLFLVSFVLITEVPFLSFGNDELRQGYLMLNYSEVNLNNFAPVGLGVLVVGLILNRIFVPKQTEKTRFVRKAGTIAVVVVISWLLMLVVLATYLLLSGQIFDGWRF